MYIHVVKYVNDTSLYSLAIGRPHHGPWWGGFNEIQGIDRFDSMIRINLQLSMEMVLFKKELYLWARVFMRSLKNVIDPIEYKHCGLWLPKIKYKYIQI